jgi:hypothetical protein
MRLTLTDFIDFVSKAGSPKMTLARQVKNRGEYDPATDYYRIIRQRLADACEVGDSPSVADLIEGCHHKKHANYSQVAQGFVKWRKKHEGKWISPPSELWTANSLEVGINPELGVVVGERPHVLKLYFKADPLSAYRINLITHLMERALRPSAPKGAVMGVLDVRNARVFTPPVPDPQLDAQLLGEAAYLAAVWPLL